MRPDQSVVRGHQKIKPRGGVKVTLHVTAGSRRHGSTGTPPHGLYPSTYFMGITMSKSMLEITLPSNLRSILIMIDGLRAMMRPDFTIQPGMISLLDMASRDLSTTITDVTAWTEEIRQERFSRQTASHKAALTRSLHPPLIRRRRR